MDRLLCRVWSFLVRGVGSDRFAHLESISASCVLATAMAIWDRFDLRERWCCGPEHRLGRVILSSAIRKADLSHLNKKD